MSAARAGMGFGVVLIGLGLFELFVRSPLGLWPAFFGWFLFMAARAEGDAARRQAGVEGLPVGAVMTPHPPVVPSAMSVAEVLAGPVYWWNGQQVAAVVGPTGWLEGVVTLEHIRHVPAPEQATTRLGDIAERIEAAPVGRPEEAMSILLGRMDAAGGRAGGGARPHRPPGGDRDARRRGTCRRPPPARRGASGLRAEHRHSATATGPRGHGATGPRARLGIVSGTWRGSHSTPRS